MSQHISDFVNHLHIVLNENLPHLEIMNLKEPYKFRILIMGCIYVVKSMRAASRSCHLYSRPLQNYSMSSYIELQS